MGVLSIYAPSSPPQMRVKCVSIRDLQPTGVVSGSILAGAWTVLRVKLSPSSLWEACKHCRLRCKEVHSDMPEEKADLRRLDSDIHLPV